MSKFTYKWSKTKSKSKRWIIIKPTRCHHLFRNMLDPSYCCRNHTSRHQGRCVSPSSKYLKHRENPYIWNRIHSFPSGTCCCFLCGFIFVSVYWSRALAVAKAFLLFLVENLDTDLPSIVLVNCNTPVGNSDAWRRVISRIPQIWTWAVFNYLASGENMDCQLLVPCRRKSHWGIWSESLDYIMSYRP